MPRMTAVSGITLRASPAWMAVTPPARPSDGLMLRETIACNAAVRWQAASSGSMFSGRAPWLPRPVTVIEEGAARHHWPRPDGKFSNRKTRRIVHAEHARAERSSQTVLRMALAPPMPSSAAGR